MSRNARKYQEMQGNVKKCKKINENEKWCSEQQMKLYFILCK
jgi:hypothetical protein